MVSNILAHRDYSSGFPAKFIIEKDKIYTENSNLAHGTGELKLDRFEPYPKNPPISKVFREIGLADELGSGMRNTTKYTKLYSGGIPSFDEGDVFKITIPLKNIATAKVGPNNEDVGQDVGQDGTQDGTQGGTQDGTQNLQEIHQRIMIMIQKNNKITRRDMARELSIGTRTLQRFINEMGNIRYVGSGYSGHWEIQ